MSNELTNNAKPVLDQNNIPIEELLGSVTTYNNVEGSECKSQQLRTSARVFKKMKLDSAVVPIPIDVKKEVVKEDIKPETKRIFRPSWSQEDKNLFFDALNEFGKDFEAIHCNITNKLKKKGLPDSVMKTKDQVRHFYYRTWHKISKHLKFSDDIKKLAQELYGLINYGELRKKVGSVSEKTCMKLNELIYRGSVVIRIKGKTFRIKTPMCRALRKLNQLDEKHDDLKLPTRISVELIPKNMDTWLRIQGMSQNPRIKAFFPLQKRLSTLIKYLSCKWRTTVASAYEDTIMNSDPSISDCIPDKKVIEENKAILDPNIRLSPQPKAQIELPTINLSEYLTSQSICLNAFEERIGVKTPGEQLWVIKGASKKGGNKRSRNESLSDKTSLFNNKHPITMMNTDNNENCLTETEASNIHEVINEVIATVQDQEINDCNKDDKNLENNNSEICETIKDAEMEEFINNIRKGWTSNSCGTLSVGELYLMFGTQSKLVLEYSWDDAENLSSKIEIKNCDNMESDKDNVTNTSEDTNKNETESAIKTLEEDNSLATTLKKLLSIAKMQYRKNIVHCPCGHTCSATKSNVNVKNKSALTKSSKVNSNEKNIEKTENTPGDSGNNPDQNVAIKSVVPIVIRAPVRQFLPSSVFRRPISPNDSLRAQLDSIQRLTPRYCNRRGRRPRTKQMVVERRLPLLPNKTDSGRQIVQMNIISPGNIQTPRTIAPKILNIDKTEHNITTTLNTPTITISSNIDTPNETPTNFDSNLINMNIHIPANELDITDNAVTPSRVGSPTSISNLLELALAPQSDQILENKDDSSIPSFVGLLSNNITGTPPTSPSRILKENESNWLSSEVADFSLSSFLGHLESSTKSTPYQSNVTPDDNHLSQDVDAQLQSLFSENSVDYVSKFADLAARVDSDTTK